MFALLYKYVILSFSSLTLIILFLSKLYDAFFVNPE